MQTNDWITHEREDKMGMGIVHKKKEAGSPGQRTDAKTLETMLVVQTKGSRRARGSDWESWITALDLAQLVGELASVSRSSVHLLLEGFPVHLTRRHVGEFVRTVHFRGNGFALAIPPRDLDVVLLSRHSCAKEDTAMSTTVSLPARTAFSRLCQLTPTR